MPILRSSISKRTITALETPSSLLRLSLLSSSRKCLQTLAPSLMDAVVCFPISSTTPSWMVVSVSLKAMLSTLLSVELLRSYRRWTLVLLAHLLDCWKQIIWTHSSTLILTMCVIPRTLSRYSSRMQVGWACMISGIIGLIPMDLLISLIRTEMIISLVRLYTSDLLLPAHPMLEDMVSAGNAMVTCISSTEISIPVRLLQSFCLLSILRCFCPLSICWNPLSLKWSGTMSSMICSISIWIWSLWAKTLTLLACTWFWTPVSLTPLKTMTMILLRWCMLNILPLSIFGILMEV